MTRARSIRVALLFAVPVFLTGSARSEGLPGRASLADLHAIGQVIVTMSGAASGEESALRQVIERRLSNAGITIDQSESTQLVANVNVARDTSSSGQKHFAGEPNIEAVAERIKKLGKPVVVKDDVKKLEAIELAEAQKLGLEAFKFSTNDEMLQAMGLQETV